MMQFIDIKDYFKKQYKKKKTSADNRLTERQTRGQMGVISCDLDMNTCFKNIRQKSTFDRKAYQTAS